MTDGADLPRGALGQFAPVHNWAVHLAVRADYEGSPLTLREIVIKHRVAASTVQQWARAEGWTMRQPHRVDPHDLVGRMLALLDGQIAELETAMTNGTAEVAMLAKLVTTLDKVLMLKERTAVAEHARSSKRADELRAKIAERISELNRA